MDLGSLVGPILFAMMEAVIIVLVIRWAYFAYMESSPRQATFGKAALGLMVIDGGGHRIRLPGPPGGGSGTPFVGHPRYRLLSHPVYREEAGAA